MLKPNKISAAAALERIQALSHARLSNYRSFFGATDDIEALGLYQWNSELSTELFRVICLVEVALRNQFHRAMSLRYGVMGGSGSKDWYEHVALSPLSKSKVQGITHFKHGPSLLPRAPTPSPDDVVSGLSFGFWPHLLDLRLDVLANRVDWGPILLDVLPGHRQRQASHWAKQKHRDTLFGRLDLCNELRNRIAHHEPVWKQGPLLQEGRYRKGKPLAMIVPAPKTPTEALTRLRLLYDRLTELLGWLSPALAADHAASDLHLRCLNLLQLEALWTYRRALPPSEINLAHTANLRALRKALRYAARRKLPVIIRDGHRLVGHVTCT